MSYITFDDREDEIKISAKVPTVREIMKERSTRITGSDNPHWNHLEYFDLPVYPMDDNYHMGRVGTVSFFDSGQVNLSFLRATSLHEGINVTLVGGDYTSGDWRFIRQVVGRAIFDFVRRHYTPSVKYETKKDGVVVESGEDTLVKVRKNISRPRENARSVEITTGKEGETKKRTARRVSYTEDTGGNVTFTGAAANQDDGSWTIRNT